MSDNKEDSEGKEEEFVFDDIEKPDFSKYDGLKIFEFGKSSEKLDYNKYDNLKGFEFGKSPQAKESKDKYFSDLSNYDNKTANLDKVYIIHDSVKREKDKEKLEFLNKDKEFTQINLMRNEQNEKAIERNKVPNQKKELVRKEFSKLDELSPNIPPSEAEVLGIQPLQLAILMIYYICEIFPKNSKIDKKFFS